MMELIAGTYDEILLGFRIVEVGKELQLEASFTDHTHTGCIKSVAVSHKGVLASGGTDEIIRLLNLKKARELGSLVHHSGSVTNLQFHKNFMFSTSEDGTLCLWKAFTWECLRTFKGHKSSVTCVAVHPSGKLALTVGNDKTLHTWNLITGRSAYITNIKNVADHVRWSPSGSSYLTVCSNQVDVYTVESGDVTTSIQAETRINGIEFLNDNECVYGGEGGTVTIMDLKSREVLHSLDTETNRIKGLCLCNSVREGEDSTQWLSIASSDGYIKVYSISLTEGKYSTKLLAAHNTGFRLTCLAVHQQKSQSHESLDDQPQEEGSEATTTEQSVSPKLSKKQERKRRRQENMKRRAEEAVGEINIASQKKKKKRETQNRKANESTADISSKKEGKRKGRSKQKTVNKRL